MAESVFKIILRAIDQATPTLSKVGAAATALGSRVQRIQAAGSAFSQASGFAPLLSMTGKVARSLDQLGEKTIHMGRHLVHGMVGGAVAGGLLLEGLHKIAEWGDNIVKTSSQFGLKTDTLQAWTYAAEIAGVSTESLMTAMGQFGKRASEARRGEGEAAMFFKALEVSVEDAHGRLKSMETLLPQTLDAIKARIKAGTMSEVEAAKALFGRGGIDMVKLFRQGGKGLSEALEDLRARGGLVDPATLQDADHFNDTLKAAGIGLRGVAATILGPLYHPLTKLINQFSYWLGANKELIAGKFLAWTERLIALLKGLGRGIAEVSAFVRRLIPDLGQGALSLETWEKIGKALSLVFGVLLAAAVAHLTKKIWLFSAALWRSPITWVVAGVWLLVLAIRNWGKISKWAQDIWAAWWPLLLPLSALIVGALVPALLSAAAAWTFAAGVLAATWPVLAVIAVVGLLATGAALLYQYWEPVSTWFKEIWAEIGDGILLAMVVIGVALGGPLAAMMALGAAATWITQNWEKVGEFFSSLGKKIKNIFLDAVDYVTSIMPDWLKERLGFKVSLTNQGGPVPSAAPSPSTNAISPNASPSSSQPEPARASAASALPSWRGGGRDSQTKVVIDFNNVPPGARVREKSQTGDDIDLELGMYYGPTLFGVMP